MPVESPVCGGGCEDFELIETFRYEPERGFIRLDRHLARMATSAQTFGYPFDAAHVEEKLQVIADPHETMRVRLALNMQGGIKVTHQPYVPLPADTVWKLRIAKTRLDSNDPLLRHKTSRREIYERARAEYSAEEADDVLLLNEKAEVCEGCITSLFLAVPNGLWLTPALKCGLLPGVLRGEMLRNKDAAEASLSLWEVETTKSLFVGNSLRGLIRAHIIQ
jgi:4-amino-4-deoxychorismate lyase